MVVSVLQRQIYSSEDTEKAKQNKKNTKQWTGVHFKKIFVQRQKTHIPFERICVATGVFDRC